MTTTSQKTILVIGSLTRDDGETVALQEMAEFVSTSMGGAGSAATVVFCHFDDVTITCSAKEVVMIDVRNGRPLESYDFVWFRGKIASSRDIAHLIAVFLKEKAVPFSNQSHLFHRPHSKMAQMMHLQSTSLPFPKTVYADNAHLKLAAEQALAYPMIVKDVAGAHGNDNHLVGSSEQLDAILARSPHVSFIAQEFIQADGDYRVLIVGTEVLIIHRRGSDDTHLNNTSQGAAASEVSETDFPAHIIAECQTFARNYGCEIAGVDVIIDKNSGQHYFLEINAQPQLRTGALVDKKSDMLGHYIHGRLSEPPVGV